MAYRKINPLLWDDEWFVGLDDFDRSVWWAILSGPQVRSIPGLMVATAATLADFMRRSVDTVAAALARFAAAGKVELDDRTRLLRVVNAPRWAAEHGEPENPNVIKGWWRAWRELPDSDTKRRHLTGLREAFATARDKAVNAPIAKVQQPNAETIRAERSEGWEAAWAATFGTVSEPQGQRPAGTEKPSRNRSETVSEPFVEGSGNPLTRAIAYAGGRAHVRAFQEQEQEPLQEQEPKQSRACARASSTSTAVPIDDKQGRLVDLLRGSRDLAGMADARQVDLVRCAQDLVAEGDKFVMGGRLRPDEVNARLDSAVVDFTRAVAAAASTSQPMPPREAMRKIRSFAHTALGKSREEWSRARQTPPNGSPRQAHHNPTDADIDAAFGKGGT